MAETGSTRETIEAQRHRHIGILAPERLTVSPYECFFAGTSVILGGGCLYCGNQMVRWKIAALEADARLVRYLLHRDTLPRNTSPQETCHARKLGRVRQATTVGAGAP